MSDDDQRSSDEKKIWPFGNSNHILCVRCRRILRPPIRLLHRVGNFCYACWQTATNCLACGEAPTVIYPCAGDSSSQAIISDPTEVIFEPPGMNPHRNREPVLPTNQQDIKHPHHRNCGCRVCIVERAAELSPILEGGTTSEEESSSRLVECVADVHRANDEDETLETVTSEELTTPAEPRRFEEVVDIPNPVEAEVAEPAATVYSDDRHEPPVTDRRLVPQDSSSSNETSDPTETTTVDTPEDYSQDQRSQQIEVLPVENNTEQSNSEAGDVIDAARIMNAPECSVPVREDPPHKKADESEGLVCEDNISKEMPTESLGRDVPEGPVRASVSKSDESEDSVHTQSMARDEKSLGVDPKPEDERKESHPPNIHEGKMTTIEKFGAEERKLESSDDKSAEEDAKSHDHTGSEKQESSKLEEEISPSAQKKSESEEYDAEKVTTEKEKDESLADEESEDGSSEAESTDSEELKDKPDIPSNQKGEKLESKEGGGESAGDLLGDKESEEESCDDNKSSETKEDDVESHRKESTTEEKSVDREEVVSTKEKKSSMESPEVKDSSEEEESDEEDECKNQEASISQREKDEPKDSEREYRPLEEEDTSGSEGSDSRKKKEESEGEPKKVESPKKQLECAKETTTRYDRLTESETEDEESNGNNKKEVREEKEAEKLSAKEEGGPSQHKSSGKKASERGTSKANGEAEKGQSIPGTEDGDSENAKCSKQKVGEKDQQESSSTGDKEQISCKKSPGKSKDSAEKEESSDITEARDTVLMIVERNSPPRKPAAMEHVSVLRCMENIALGEIMKLFNFKCENHILGCKETFSPEELVAHAETCLFQTVQCEFQDCIWTGTLEKYTRHFLRHTDVEKLQTVDDRFDLPNWNTQDTEYILQTSGGCFILRMRILEGKLYYLVYDLRRTVRSPKIDLLLEYYSKSGAKFTFRCNITRSAKLNCFDERKATELDLSMFNSFFPPEDKPCMSIHVESDDLWFRMRTTSISRLKCKKCGLHMDSPIRRCMYGHNVCGSCYQNVEECPQCDTPLIIYKLSDNFNWKDAAKYVCKFGKEGDSRLTAYHESSLCTFHPWTCPKCPESKLKPLFDYFDLIDHMQYYHHIPVLQNSESIKKLSQLSYEVYFIKFSKLFLFKSVYLKETDTSEFYVIYIGPKQDRYRYEIQIKYKKGFYTKYESLSCECAYNKSSEILREEPQEAEQTTPVNAMSPAEVYVSPDSSDLLSKEAVSTQISGTKTSAGKSRYLTPQTYSDRESQTPTSTRLPYYAKSIGNTVQESPTPADTPGITESPQMPSAAIPKTMSPELSVKSKSESLAIKGKGETDGEKLKPDEGIVIQNGLERFGERFEFDVRITKITARNFS